MTENGKPYAPIRYKEIVRERYFISKHTNTSYKDVGEMTPIEREYVAEFIVKDLEKQKEALEGNVKQK